MLDNNQFTGLKCAQSNCGAEAVIEDDGSAIAVHCTVCINIQFLYEYPEDGEDQ